LVAPNNEVIAKSEMYKSKDGCENGIRAVKEYTPTAFIVDKTA
ncbi:MAG: YegP family protein, partial [Candidatus Bathyarchaeota archaeon]